MLAADDKYIFALASVIIGLKTNAPKLAAMADFFVYTQNISPQNREALLKIQPVNILEFHLPFDTVQIKTLGRYSELTFARYEAFPLLKQYKNVLYLDSDIIILKELLPLLDTAKNGFALCYDDNLVAANFSAKIDGYNLKTRNRNAGIMLITDDLQNQDEIYSKCYKITKQHAAKLEWPDQGILNILLQHFKIVPGEIPLQFNAHPITSYIRLKETAILHAMGPYKFWNGFYLKQWQRFYGQWLAAGGKEQIKLPFDKRTGFMFKAKLFLEKVPFLWYLFYKFNKFRFSRYNYRIVKRMGL